MLVLIYFDLSQSNGATVCVTSFFSFVKINLMEYFKVTNNKMKPLLTNENAVSQLLTYILFIATVWKVHWVIKHLFYDTHPVPTTLGLGHHSAKFEWQHYVVLSSFLIIVKRVDPATFPTLPLLWIVFVPLTLALMPCSFSLEIWLLCSCPFSLLP